MLRAKSVALFCQIHNKGVEVILHSGIPWLKVSMTFVLPLAQILYHFFFYFTDLILLWYLLSA